MQLIPIGALSTLSQLSQRALRLYAEEGILKPVRIDTLTGYRYYSLEQLPRAQRIRQLREAGVPLADIKQFLNSENTASALQQLQKFWQSQIQLHQQRAEAYKQLLQQLLQDEEEPPFYPVAVRYRPGQWLLEIVGHYTTESMKAAAPELFERLYRYIEEQGERPAAPGFLAFPDPMLADTAGKVRFCVPVERLVPPRGAMVLREDPARDEAWLSIGPEVAFYPQLLMPIERLVRWISHRGLAFEEGGLRYCWLPGEPARIEISWSLIQPGD